jgi:hypothetical protein
MSDVDRPFFEEKQTFNHSFPKCAQEINRMGNNNKHYLEFSFRNWLKWWSSSNIRK